MVNHFPFSDERIYTAEWEVSRSEVNAAGSKQNLMNTAQFPDLFPSSFTKSNQVD